MESREPKWVEPTSKPVDIRKTNIFSSNSIFFYDENQPYYIFSNNYNAPITVNGIIFRTSEHLYQWQKFSDPVIKLRIVGAPTGKMAAEIAEKNKYLIVPDFDSKKDSAMLIALRAKFSQHPDLGKELMSTGNNTIIQHNMYDQYWSDGGNGSGSNMLGKHLMKVREELTNGSISFDKPVVSIS